MKSNFRFRILVFSMFLALFSIQLSGCKAGEGCQLEDKYHYKTDKDGNLSKKKGKSNLWSKKQRKKMGK